MFTLWVFTLKPFPGKLPRKSYNVENHRFLCRTFRIVKSQLRKVPAEPLRFFCRTLGAEPSFSGPASSSPIVQGHNLRLPDAAGGRGTSSTCPEGPATRGKNWLPPAASGQFLTRNYLAHIVSKNASQIVSRRQKKAFLPLSKFRESETTIKIKFAFFRGGGWGRGAERKIVQNAIFRGKRHDNKILKVKILLSRIFVVMAQALSKLPPW